MKEHFLIIALAILLLLWVSGCSSPSPSQSAASGQETVKSSEGSSTVDAERSGQTSGEQQSGTGSGNGTGTEGGTDAEVSDDAFVRVKDYIPNIAVDLKYATVDNFTGSIIYEFSDAYLRYGTVMKLAEVQQELESMGMGLKIWDAFRPVSAQFRLWEVCPDATYVANPNRGFSSHSRGNTVDITLVHLGGDELQMPTGFDDFSLKADRDYSDCDEVSAGNARFLEDLMVKHDFKPYSGEWWHFSDCTSYETDEEFEPPAS